MLFYDRIGTMMKDINVLFGFDEAKLVATDNIIRNYGVHLNPDEIIWLTSRAFLKNYEC